MMQLTHSHHLSLTLCWAFPVPQHVAIGIYRHTCIWIQTCNLDTREDPKIYMTGFDSFCIQTESDFSCQNFPLCRFSSHQSALPSDGMREKTIILFVFDYCLCFQKLEGHD